MRIAAFQHHAIFDNIDHVCDVLERDLRWAVSEGIQIALFPETFLLGHSYEPQVIAARVDRLANGGLETLCSRLAWADPTVIVGAFERRGDLVANSAFAKAYPNEPGVIAGTEYPAAQWHRRSIHALQARARQTGCWIVSADVTGRHGQSISYGCTVIVSPNGTIVSRAREGHEDVAVYEIQQ